MHASSYDLMGRLFADLDLEEGSRVLDVGSLDVNGTYRPIIENAGHVYTGLDMRPGPNVDICMRAADLATTEPSRFDAVISGQMLEHDPDPFGSVHGMAHVLKHGGHLLLIAPREQHRHDHPFDCWRFLPDGMTALAEAAGLLVMQTDVGPKTRDSIIDCWVVAKKAVISEEL